MVKIDGGGEVELWKNDRMFDDGVLITIDDGEVPVLNDDRE